MRRPGLWVANGRPDDVSKMYSWNPGAITCFYEHLNDSMQNVGFVPRDSYDDFITRFKRLLGRSLAEKRDVRLMHKLLQIYETKINDLEKQIGEKREKKKIY